MTPPTSIRSSARSVGRAFVLSVSCLAATSAPATAAAAGESRPTDPLAVVRAYMKEWSSLPEHRGVRPQDIPAAADSAAKYFAADGVYLDSTVGAPLHGVQAAREQVILPFLTSFPNARWEMTDRPKVQGDTLEFHWRFSGNNWGPFILDPSCAGKGEVLLLDGHSKIRVRHGLVAYQEDTYDPAAIPAQLSRAAAACKPAVGATPREK